MSIVYLKKASKEPSFGENNTRDVVEKMLRDIESRGESAVYEYSKKFDNWQGDIVVSKEQIKQAKSMISEQLCDDIKFAYDRVSKFAKAQRDSIKEFETELSQGLFAGQKVIPVETVGCYVPGGRYAHIASAIMSIATAKVAGVDNVIAASVPRDENGIHPAILYAMDLSGADIILQIGGVQGIAALGYGLFTQKPADILVGPGNKYVAEAKRQLFGRCGIDMIAGPTEIGVIADETADPNIVAADLVGQAEHGFDSPAWLFTTSTNFGKNVMKLVPELINALPKSQKITATESWAEYGEVIYCDTREEIVSLANRYAPEHLEVQALDLPWWQENLKSYGSLFVGEEATVAFGDKCSGTNHILPTKRVARYSGGLCAQKFLKVVTYQRQTREATREVAMVAARLSRQEGMEAHARTCDIRLAKYFPGESFDLGI